MITRILASLGRQLRALDLLEELLGEEFSLLARRDAQAVTSLEFSIQELLRQIAGERTSLYRIYATMDPAAKRLAQLLDRFDDASRSEAEGLLAAIERVEKRCSTVASGNYQMALGLYDTTKSCLDHLQSHLIPKKAVYGSRGRVDAAMPAPGRVDGRC
jgi:hypothetical protein